MDHSNAQLKLHQLDEYYDHIYRTILSRQNTESGLFPASTAVNNHGDYTDAWVRDNLYSIQAIWGLYLAYQNYQADHERCYQLSDACVKLMRGLLSAMQRQSSKVERFKYTQSPSDALHAKYDTQTGNQVVDDDKWGHLQLDATSFFILMLARMTQSGLRIIFDLKEVNFVQNLVWYVGRGYRTPDFGIWERGNKINNGQLELNASSVGMVKASLQAIRNVRLMGHKGKIFVNPDEIARCRTTLESLLPRESRSKEVDAACLTVIGYPAFAIEKQKLVDLTRQRIDKKLAGPWGCKRFLRDGHQTVLEDNDRLHYEPEELNNFANIESEWPLFYTYYYIEALFEGNKEKVALYRNKLDGLGVEKNGEFMLPELYFVPTEHVEAEKQNPGSQGRLPNPNIPLVWAQSLYYLGRLIEDQLLQTSQIDPLNAFARIGSKLKSPVQVSIICANEEVKAQLALQGVYGQTHEDIRPILLFPATELTRIFSVIGQNRQQGMTGRPPRHMRSLSTAQVYFIDGRSCMFVPGFQNRLRFYFASDNQLLIENFSAELSYVSRHWDQAGLPTVLMHVDQDMLNAPDSHELIRFLQQLNQSDDINGVKTSCGNLLELLDQAGMEQIEYLSDYQLPLYSTLHLRLPGKWLKFDANRCEPISQNAMSHLLPELDGGELSEHLRKSSNLYEQMDILKRLLRMFGADYEPGIAPRVTVRILLEEIYFRATEQHYWSLIRQAAGLLNLYWDAVDDAVSEIIARQKQLVVGRAYSNRGLIDKPRTNKEIIRLIRTNCGKDDREALLNQEVIFYISFIMRDQPELFEGLMTLRPGHLIMLLVGNMSSELQIAEDVAYERVMSLSPYELQQKIKNVISGYQINVGTLVDSEKLTIQGPIPQFSHAKQSLPEKLPANVSNWAQWRAQVGVMPKLSGQFYKSLWHLFEKCHGVVVGDRFSPTARIESAQVLSSMTEGEQQFTLLVEVVLNAIDAAPYRQLCIEALDTLVAFANANEHLVVEDYIVIDVLVAAAVKINWNEQYHLTDEAYEQQKGEAWEAFYDSPPTKNAQYFEKAVKHLLDFRD